MVAVRSSSLPEYHVWAGMKARCGHTKSPPHKRYGGRGIKVCERWRTSFQAFLEDMGRRPSDKHSIDRINNDGNYEPGNCRWATSKQQARNTCRNIRLTLNGETKTRIAWEELGFEFKVIRVPSKLVFAITKLAMLRGCSVTDIVNEAIREGLASKGFWPPKASE